MLLQRGMGIWSTAIAGIVTFTDQESQGMERVNAHNNILLVDEEGKP